MSLSQQDQPRAHPGSYTEYAWVAVVAVGIGAVGCLLFSLFSLRRAMSPDDLMPTSPPINPDVRIQSEVTLSEAAGIFAASGTAVQSGILCPQGDVYDLEYYDLNYEGDELRNLHVFKHFNCSDGSGSFEMDLEVEILMDPPATLGTWRIVGGSKDYNTLQGTGALTGTYTSDDTVVDVYTGSLIEE